MSDYLKDRRFLKIKNEKIKNGIKFVMQKEYGDILSYEDLTRILCCDLENEKEKYRFKGMMAKIKNFTMNFGYVLRNVQGIGYYILRPKHISSYCYRTYIQKSQKLLDKSEIILQNVETEQLSKERKSEYNDICNLNEELISTIETIIETSSYGMNKDYYNNLKDERGK